MRCASDVNRIFLSCRAFSVILASFVDIHCPPLCVGYVSLLRAYSVLPLPPVRGFPTLRVLPAGPTSTATSASLWMVLLVGVLHFFSMKIAVDLPSSVVLPFPPCRALRPRRGLRFPRPLRKSTIAFQVFDLVGPRISHEALSLHLHYGLDVALSTLNPYRYLYVFKTRFRVGRLFPLPGWELHPLKAPSLPRRTKEVSQIGI